MDALILAGGRARRMGGRSKALLTLGGRTFIELILETLAPLVETVILSTNEPDAYRHLDLRMVPDDEEGRGPLMGIRSGLRASRADACFVVAADAPLLQGGLVMAIAAAAASAPGHDVVVPVWEGKLEPLCAWYSRACLPAIERTIGLGRVVSFYPLVRACRVPEEAVRAADPRGLSFVNVNGPEDLDRLRILAAQAPPA